MGEFAVSQEALSTTLCVVVKSSSVSESESPSYKSPSSLSSSPPSHESWSSLSMSPSPSSDLLRRFLSDSGFAFGEKQLLNGDVTTSLRHVCKNAVVVENAENLGR
ncbi:cathepsin B [Striga asiatica]|uniref:Cathepsin B n=1 Tax=Striga asiatica TaxID=4170 RepID=A0A5A7R9X8_STRAF|nr:cathepsin B [Striga asiatica]